MQWQSHHLPEPDFQRAIWPCLLTVAQGLTQMFANISASLARHGTHAYAQGRQDWVDLAAFANASVSHASSNTQLCGT